MQPKLTPQPHSGHKSQRRLHPSAHGGILRNRLKGRGRRTISTRYSMHVVLRSTLARGARSFSREANRVLLDRLLTKHSQKFGVQLLGVGNAGNHLHLRLKVDSREQYFGFIRALTGEIALKFKRIQQTATSKHSTNAKHPVDRHNLAARHNTVEKHNLAAKPTTPTPDDTDNRNFWDRRPFSSIVAQAKYVARLIDYIKINNLEGDGITRAFARLTVQRWRDGTWSEFEPA